MHVDAQHPELVFVKEMSAPSTSAAPSEGSSVKVDDVM